MAAGALRRATKVCGGALRAIERVRGAACACKCASWDYRYDDARGEVGAGESDFSGAGITDYFCLSHIKRHDGAERRKTHDGAPRCS